MRHGTSPKASEADRFQADLAQLFAHAIKHRREEEIASYQNVDHFDLNVCCQHCSPPVRCVGLAIGRPAQINGAGWETSTSVLCPTCKREYVIAVSMTPTTNPSAKAGTMNKAGI